MHGSWEYRPTHQLREVYRALRLVVNCFQPSLKLQAKVPKGEQVRRVYDAAQTPLQRLLASGVLSEDRQRDLRERVQQIDPLALSEYLDALRHALLCGAHLPSAVAGDGPVLATAPLLPGGLYIRPAAQPEEEPERTGHQEAPSSSEEIAELAAHATRSLTLLEEAVSAADQPSAQAQPHARPTHRHVEQHHQGARGRSSCPDHA